MRQQTAAAMLLVALLVAEPLRGAASATGTESEAGPKQGDRVRVLFFEPGRGLQTLTGEIAWLTPQAIHVRAPGAWQSRSVPWPNVRRLERSEGTHAAPEAGRGARLGAWVGAGVGTYFALLGSAACDTRPCPGRMEASIVATAGLGAGIGALLGLTKRAERWRQVEMSGVSVGLRPGPRGTLGARITLRF